MKLDSKEPTGPIEDRWEKHRFDMKLVHPKNKRQDTGSGVGTGRPRGSAGPRARPAGRRPRGPASSNRWGMG